MIGDEQVFDSRDVEARIEELEAEHPAHLSDDEREELQTLRELREDVELGHPTEWRDGMTFIRDDYLADHAKQYAEDIDGIDASRWPYDCIDWDEAGRELAMDYRTTDWNGETWHYY